MGWMIYGANGYTGELIAREAKSRGRSPLLAGRSASKVTALAKELRLSPKVFALNSPAEIVEALRGIRLVLNCAGPFSKTAGPLMRACMSAKADYLDITGEIDVLEGAHCFDADAKSVGVVLCPGAGFDVVPTDCIALMLKNALPEANELALGSRPPIKECQLAPQRPLSKDWARAGKFAAAAGSSIFRWGADRATSILGVV